VAGRGRTQDRAAAIGKDGERLRKAVKAARAHRVQKVLGRHQDSVAARDVLRRLASEAFLQGENAFSYGRLHALEQSLAAGSEEEFYQDWTSFPAKLLK
jgi:hypothetical protein